MPDERLQLSEWQSHWANDGAFLSLTFLTPLPDICRNDQGAYDALVARRGLARADKATGSWDVPVPGYRRISDRVWEAFVVLPAGAILGEILPATLDPCRKGSVGLYRLTGVAQLRASAGALRRTLIDVQDAIESPLAVAENAAGAVGEVGGAVAGGVGSVAAHLVAPLLIPTAIGFVVYKAVKAAL